ncbi:MAG: DUF1697 domain-containing protein [Gallionella sp.]|nr:DUF1697 domain-containing protein [Gallionella sp.]
MKTCIALLRGINVGGKNILPMKELVAVLKSLGLQNIKTHIQSGNAVFQSKTSDTAKLANTISAAIRKSHGFEPQVLLLDSVSLHKVIKTNPYPEAEAAPNTLHVAFLAAIPPKPDLDALERIRAASERFQLAAGMERLLGVAITSRNWNTVRKLKEMIDEP